ncbi:hypothetical protein [Photobacterium sp. 1_MG-2023]|uniref:hypothetical protein n=1 Tax=Photobacterium sp. 1_MG-2023 TaxID=3062646 RepID=UPI0026E1BCA3|nr:hypothetical protein [Photobacterium sp. 1_MG-2023]MDO6705166.1 hypothetical protein [Photobacterium sp. 1_MG-2023]
MTSISQTSAYQAAMNQTSRTNESKATGSVATPTQTTQPSATLFQSGNQISQLSHLLTQLHVLQRLFANLPSALSAQGSPIAQWLTQLVLPQTPTDIARWLQQGAGRESLKALVTQLSQPDSPLARLLASLPEASQGELKALIRIAAEQRIAGQPVSRDENTPFILHLPQANGREFRLSVQSRTAKSGSGRKPHSRSWVIKLELPVAAHDCLLATAVWQDEKLNLSFDSAQPEILKQAELLTPQLTRRLKQLDIECESVTYRHAPATADAPDLVMAPQHGIRISV